MSCPAPGSATVCSLGAANPGAEMGASRCDKGVYILILLSLGVISTLHLCPLCKYWRKSGPCMELDTFLKKGLLGICLFCWTLAVWWRNLQLSFGQVGEGSFGFTKGQQEGVFW